MHSSDIINTAVMPGSGFVRITGRELADQKRSRLSRGELTPLGQGGGAVLLEDVAAVEMTVAGGGRKCDDFCGRWSFDEAQLP